MFLICILINHSLIILYLILISSFENLYRSFHRNNTLQLLSKRSNTQAFLYSIITALLKLTVYIKITCLNDTAWEYGTLVHSHVHAYKRSYKAVYNPPKLRILAGTCIHIYISVVYHNPSAGYGHRFPAWIRVTFPKLIPCESIPSIFALICERARAR